MKHTKQVIPALLLMSLFACRKSGADSSISLTASATQIPVGQTLSVTLSANANASNWSVNPSATATKTYGLTTSKVNYFSFSQPGTYTISVRARNISYDSTAESLENAWNLKGGSGGSCTKGVDTASVAVNVISK